MELRFLAALGLVFSAAPALVVHGVGRGWIKTSNSLQPVLSHVNATHALGASLAPATITVGGGKVNVKFAPGHLELPSTLVIRWLLAAARAVTAFYGRFPVHEAKVLIVPVEIVGGILSGTSRGTRPVSTRIYLGELVDNGELKNDWVMTHEMVHYAFPSMSEEHHWIEEGIVTYVEPLARLESNEIGGVKVWSDLIKGLQIGLPAPATRVSTIPTAGAARIGEAPCFVCSPMSRSAGRPKTVTVCATRFGRSSMLAGTWKHHGR